MARLKRNSVRCCSLLVACGLGVSMFAGTGAAAQTPQVPGGPSAVSAVAKASVPARFGHGEVQKAIRALNPYVHRAPDGTYVLRAPANLVASIPTGAYATVMASLTGINGLVRSGALVPAGTGLVPAGRPAHTRSGSNGFACYWWGCELDLDSVTTSRIEGLLNAGAGAAAIAAALQAAGVITAGSALATAIVSGILWMGAGVIQACANENGVALYWAGIPGVVGAPWCSGQ